MNTKPTTSDTPLDILYVGGRVIDPETNLDAMRAVGVRGDRIEYVGTEVRPSRRVIDISGLTLAPGFIDIHSHAQTLSGARLQALDGVTTALELEAGAGSGIQAAVRAAQDTGRPINYGFSASWARARYRVLGDIRDESFEYLLGDGSNSASWNSPMDDAGIDATLKLVERELDAGAVGIGVPVGFAPDSGRKEFFRVAQLAATRDVPMFVHQRHVSNVEPEGSLEGTLEVISAAAGTGAALHLCHLNSTSLHDIYLITDALRSAQAQGCRVTTEAYPYTFSSTNISAKFLQPERLHRMNLTPASLTHVRSGEPVETVERLIELRRDDPGSGCIVRNYNPDDERDMDAFLRALTFPGAAIASDALPLSTAIPGLDPATAWPPPEGAFTHPRSAGTFARAISWAVRELGVMSLAEMVARATLIPARVLERAVPAARYKGRVQRGCDADLIVFDPDRVQDTAQFGSATPSIGFEFVMVGGQFTVENGELALASRPGRWLAAR